MYKKEQLTEVQIQNLKDLFLTAEYDYHTSDYRYLREKEGKNRPRVTSALECQRIKNYHFFRGVFVTLCTLNFMPPEFLPRGEAFDEKWEDLDND